MPPKPKANNSHLVGDRGTDKTGLELKKQKVSHVWRAGSFDSLRVVAYYHARRKTLQSDREWSLAFSVLPNAFINNDWLAKARAKEL